MSIRKKLLAVALLPLAAIIVLAGLIFSVQSLKAQSTASASEAFAHRLVLSDAAIEVGAERLAVVRDRDATEIAARVDELLSDIANRPQEVRSSMSRASEFLGEARRSRGTAAVNAYNQAIDDLLDSAQAVEVEFASVDDAANGAAIAQMVEVIESTDKAWIQFASLGDDAVAPSELAKTATLFSLAEEARQAARISGIGETAELMVSTIRVTDAMSDYQESAVDSLFSSNQRVVSPEEGLSAAFDYRARWQPAYERAAVSLSVDMSNDGDEARRSQLLAAVGGVLGLLLFGVFAVIIERSISNPLQDLLDATDDLVGDAMPEMIARMRVVAAGKELDSPPFIERHSDDEIGDLVDSINDLARTTHRLASEHVSLRHNTHATLFDFGERQARLMDRLLEGLNKLVIDEQNIAMLARLGELDHLASTIRRNAQSMVVLGGDYSERSWSAPVAIEKIVRSSVAHVEDYDRIDHARLHSAWVRGSAVSDLQHILAELLENGLNNSEAKTRVVVDGFWADERYVIVVSDSGLGMSAAQISLNSGRLREMPRLDNEPATKLGLAVIGRLARHHGIEVSLTAAEVGTNAIVTLPAALVSKTEEVQVPASLAGTPTPRTQRFDAQLPHLTPESVPPGALTSTDEPIDGFFDTLYEKAPNEPPPSLRGDVSTEIATAIEGLDRLSD